MFLETVSSNLMEFDLLADVTDTCPLGHRWIYLGTFKPNSAYKLVRLSGMLTSQDTSCFLPVICD